MRPTVATRAAAVDVTAVVGLGVLALLGFRGTYIGWSFLIVGVAGLAAGAGLALAIRRLRQPALVLAAALVVMFFAAGVPLVLPGEPWLDPASFRALAEVVVLGWKQLLTTLPPVDTAGGLLVVPFALGLLCGAAGTALARGLDQTSRTGGAELLRTAVPAAVPLAMLGAVLALGTQEPAAALADGVFAAVGCLAWVAARRRRHRPAVHGSRRSARRTIHAAAVLAAAAAIAIVAGPALPGAAARTVLRDVVVPPLDLSAYPSPLVGFRKYTQDANKLWDQKLFTVTGLPEGATVRIATLDDYDGSVWGVTDTEGFRRVGAGVQPPPAGATSPLAVVRVTVEPAYAAAADVNSWLPQAGEVLDVEFHGPRGRELAAGLHYNQSLSAGIVTARLKAGDSYTMNVTFPVAVLPQDVQPAGRPSLTDNARSLLASKVAAWTANTSDLSGRLAAAATYLRENGAYSDGGVGETQYLPGHSTGRLTAFLQGEQPVGDDEQYAAAYALVANHLGVPARVVLGARPDAQGVVRGSSVHAWVEVQVADGAWAPVPETEFMPDPSKRPKPQPPVATEKRDAAVVPPPNAIRLPTTPTDTSRTPPTYPPPVQPSWWEALWEAIRPFVVWGGPPVALVALVIGAILGVKARRRARRRAGGSPANRFAAAWRELVDGARDIGVTMPSGLSLSEQAGRLEDAPLLGGRAFAGLADRVEEAVFGPGDPTGDDAAEFWITVDQARADLVRPLIWWRRIVTALSLRSLRPPTPGPVVPIGGQPT
jgi:hypothetical protein